MTGSGFGGVGGVVCVPVSVDVCVEVSLAKWKVVLGLAPVRWSQWWLVELKSM